MSDFRAKMVNMKTFEIDLYLIEYHELSVRWSADVADGVSWFIEFNDY